MQQWGHVRKSCSAWPSPTQDAQQERSADVEDLQALLEGERAMTSALLDHAAVQRALSEDRCALHACKTPSSLAQNGIHVGVPCSMHALWLLQACSMLQVCVSGTSSHHTHFFTAKGGNVWGSMALSTCIPCMHS